MFGLHLLLAIGLAAFADALSPLGMLVAVVLVHLVLRAGASVFGVERYVRRVERGVGFAGWFLREVLAASLEVARIALRREVRPSPAVVAIDLRSRDERIVTLVAMLVTLTPGTLALDYEPRSGRILVHALDARSRDETVGSVRAIERRLLAWIHAGAETPGEGTDER